jgi:transposase-like protein
VTERKVYTEEYKIEAVRLGKERGSLTEATRDLGVRNKTLSGWKRQMEATPDNPFLGNGNPRDSELFQFNARMLASERK